MVRFYCRGTATVVWAIFKCAEDPVLDMFGIGEARLLEAEFDFGDFFDFFRIVAGHGGGGGSHLTGEVGGFIGGLDRNES